MPNMPYKRDPSYLVVMLYMMNFADNFPFTKISPLLFILE